MKIHWKMMMKAVLSAAIGFCIVGSVHAADCDAARQDYLASGKMLHTTPSFEALNDAMYLHALSPEVGRCVYPAFTVEQRPVGEYERFKEGGPELVTLTDRTVYRMWGYEIQTAAITIPETMKVEVQQNGTSYRLLVTPRDSVVMGLSPRVVARANN